MIWARLQMFCRAAGGSMRCLLGSRCCLSAVHRTAPLAHPLQGGGGAQPLVPNLRRQWRWRHFMQRFGTHSVFLLLAVLALAQQPAAQQPPPQSTPRITRIEFTPAKADEGGGVFISLIGTGTCTYAIDFG